VPRLVVRFLLKAFENTERGGEGTTFATPLYHSMAILPEPENQRTEEPSTSHPLSAHAWLHMI